MKYMLTHVCVVNLTSHYEIEANSPEEARRIFVKQGAPKPPFDHAIEPMDNFPSMIEVTPMDDPTWPNKHHQH